MKNLSFQYLRQTAVFFLALIFFGLTLTQGEEKKENDSQATVISLADLIKEGAKIGWNKDKTVKSIDFTPIAAKTPYFTLDPQEANRFKTARVLRGKGVFSDELAQEAQKMPELTEVLWLDVEISDAALQNLASLKKIKKLRLTNLKTTPKTTVLLAAFPSLADLDLSAATLTDEDLAPLGTMKKLTRLNLYQTQTTDKGLENLLPLAKQIVWLNLDATQIDDEAGPLLAQFENLTFTHLGRTVISDKIIESLAHLQKLEKIHVTRTQITPDGAAALAEKLPNTEIVSVPEENK